MQETQNQGALARFWKWISTIVIFCLLMLTLIIGSGEMLQGQMLRYGEKWFGDPASGVQYSFLRGDPEKPTCNPNANVDAEVQKRIKEAENDDFASLFGPPNPDELRQSVLAAQQICAEKYQTYEKLSSHISPGLKAYRTAETALLYVTRLGVDWQQVLLMIIFGIAGITTTLGLHHIAIRPPSTKKDFLVYNVSMVAATALLLTSTGFYLKGLIFSDLPVEMPKLIFHSIWVTLFFILFIISAIKLFNPPKVTEEGNWGLAGLSVPLFASMGIITGISFIFFMNYQSGIGIYLGQMEEFSSIFLKLALFIWIGMLLKQASVVDYFLDLVRPFRFSPETLAIILMAAGAVLTAYTGASGIFVIAAGAIIYKEVYEAGARRQYALALTAMSGSLGVVLRPCLLIVVIAALNNQVKTDELYGKGLYVFLVSLSLLWITSLSLAKEKFHLRRPSEALPESAGALQKAAPYIILAFLIIAFFQFGLDSKLNEFTAAVILPFVLLFVLLYDKLFHGKSVLVEKVTAYLAVPILFYGLYKLINGIFSGVVGWTGYDVSLDVVSKVGGWDINWTYVAIAVLALIGYRFAIAAYNRHGRVQHVEEAKHLDTVGREPIRSTFVGSVGSATAETIGHIGALIMLMALSVAIGGLIERSEVMTALPTEFSSTLIALMLFTFVLVIVGMIMDPFGAAILVNATIAPIAYESGIHPVHFWIIVLTAFELGYLSPPVALNQLLARQVVGEDEMREADAEVKHKSFYYRYERWILPFGIMLVTLLIVAYVPYFFKMFGWYA